MMYKRRSSTMSDCVTPRGEGGPGSLNYEVFEQNGSCFIIDCKKETVTLEHVTAEQQHKWAMGILDAQLGKPPQSQSEVPGCIKSLCIHDVTFCESIVSDFCNTLTKLKGITSLELSGCTFETFGNVTDLLRAPPNLLELTVLGLTVKQPPSTDVNETIDGRGTCLRILTIESDISSILINRMAVTPFVRSIQGIMTYVKDIEDIEALHNFVQSKQRVHAAENGKGIASSTDGPLFGLTVLGLDTYEDPNEVLAQVSRKMLECVQSLVIKLTDSDGTIQLDRKPVNDASSGHIVEGRDLICIIAPGMSWNMALHRGLRREEIVVTTRTNGRGSRSSETSSIMGL
ncbi:hypothetical protein AcW1_003860 [Taiwanofungus camphoratus]|nr:hypothetical protein AcW1_003860 [Antrodia cinnamomea]